MTGAGAGGGPHVQVFSGATGSQLASFYAYASNFSGGVRVATADITGDGRADLVTGAGAGGGPHVRVIDGVSGAQVAGFYAFDGAYTGGVNVAASAGRIFAGGNPGGAALARVFNSAGALQTGFSGLGSAFQQGLHLASGTMQLFDDTPQDDSHEENDSLAAASDLGTPTSTMTVGGLHLLDAADWFRFRLNGTGSASSYVRIEFQHSAGDVDLGLHNSSGVLVRRSDGVGNSEQVSLDGLGAGEYFIRVYGYQGVHNPDYSLAINPATSSGGGGGSGSGSVLYVNFDGATITTSDLNRWASGQWNPAWLPGASGGITVNSFFANRGDREQIISGILNRLATDLAPFGITVQRHTGLAVENVGATTLFAGNSTLTHPHVACDVDFGNNNLTDIAFIGEENWGSAASIITALSDVFLHEAGHTYGLYHVQVVQGGVLYPESMGLRYSSPQAQWLQDVSFMDRTFIEFRDADGNWHGPGGGQSQNSYRTLLSNFDRNAPAFTGNLAAVDASQPGVLAIATSSAADQISIAELGGGVVEITINGQYYTVLGGLEQVVIDTLGDALDQVHVTGPLSFELFVGGGGSFDAKLDAALRETWNGSSMSQPGPGLGCSCPMCTAALEGALAGEGEMIPSNEQSRPVETDFVGELPSATRLASKARRDKEGIVENLTLAADHTSRHSNQVDYFSAVSSLFDQAADELDGLEVRIFDN